MGDSEGERRAFDDVSEDIAAAIDCFRELSPTLERIVLWGLCDAGSAAMIHGASHERVSAMILLNPWVQSGDYSLEVKLSHYYAPLLKGRETWRRFFGGNIEMLPAIREFVGDSALLVKRRLGAVFGRSVLQPFVAQMLSGLKRFEGRSLFILSQQDLTAQEFLRLLGTDRRWGKALSGDRVERREIEGADHTFSTEPLASEVTRLTVDWVRLHG